MNDTSSKKSSKLQLVIARLATSYKLITAVLEDIDILNSYFDLSTSEYEILENHLTLHGYSISIAAQLLEEKRWNELLSTIKYTNDVLGLSNTEDMWTKYLHNIDLSQLIPQSPLIESINFLSFVANKSLVVDQNHLDIIEYELKRNKTMLYVFDRLPHDVISDISLFKKAIHKIVVNPSLVAFIPRNQGTHKYVFSKIFKKDNVDTDTIICFYKNRTTLKTHRIFISSKLYVKITSLGPFQNMVKCSNNEDDLLKYLYENNLIHFEEVYQC